MKITVGDSGLCCCTCVTYFVRQLTPLCVDSQKLQLDSLSQAGLLGLDVQLLGGSGGC